MPPAPDSLVLLHGFASTFDHGWCQTGWVDILGDFGLAVPEIDLPGHGSSPRPVDPELYVALEEAMIGALPQPTDAVGFSAGAEVLVRAAAVRPDHFTRLVLLGVGDNLLDAPDPGPVLTSLTAEEEPDDIPARLFHRLARSTGNDPEALSAFLRRPRTPVTVAQLSGIGCPVLFVLGERDPVATADRVLEALPDASLVRVPGVDHFATPSNVVVIDATLKFLDLV